MVKRHVFKRGVVKRGAVKMGERKILTTERVRRFARRGRDCCRRYRVLDKVGSIDGQEIIEKMRKKQKAHRNIIDMEPRFLNTQ